MSNPYYKTMTPNGLRTEYRAQRQLMVTWSQMAGSPKAANGMGRALRAVELIERIADMRGVDLGAQ